MMNNKQLFTALGAGALGFALAAPVLARDPAGPGVAETLRASFHAKGQAKLDRLVQTDLQRTCSKYAQTGLPKAEKARLEKAALDSVKYPSDGQYLGNWKEGEKIAQYGRGFQYSDKAEDKVGGNCYACHQLTKEEVSYGTIGPSLNNYGKLRGSTPEVVKYTWARLWNSHSFAACNVMPRFGAGGLLTEAQLKDLMALLLDPKSPVNQ